MATVIAKKLYVTVQHRPGGASNGKIGFMSPYTADAAFTKRQKTQDEWAYGRGVLTDIDTTDDSVSMTVDAGSKVDVSVIFMADCFPRIVKNELLEGFEISQNVRRSGWRGAGNVTWRIADPRGFDLEISSENFASIINCVDMKKGVIVGKCIWGRDGPNNVLLPENSEPYVDATKLTDFRNLPKTPISELTPGDKVILIESSSGNGYTNCTYAGKYWVVQYPVNSREMRSNSREMRFSKSQYSVYVFCADGEYIIQTSPKVSVLSKAVDKFDTAVVASDMTRIIHAGKYSERRTLSSLKGTPLLVSPTKINAALIKTSLTLVDPSEVNTEYDVDTSMPYIVEKIGTGKYGLLEKYSKYSDDYLSSVDVHLEKENKLVIGKRQRVNTPTTAEYSFYNLRLEYGDTVIESVRMR